MSDHAYVVAAILASGGRLAASFELDADGHTVGARLTANRFYRCSMCGEDGHSKQRCSGPGNEPKPTHAQRRRDLVTGRTLETAKAELAKRIAERGGK